MVRRRLVGKQPAPQTANDVYPKCDLWQVWQRPCLAQYMRRFLEPKDWCSFEGTTPFWQSHAVGTSAWRSIYENRFGKSVFQGLHQTPRDHVHQERWFWKFNYFREVIYRIVPGERVAGLQLKSDSSDLRTKPCSIDEIEERRMKTVNLFSYNPNPYLSPGQGYRFLKTAFPGGPVRRLDERNSFSSSSPSLDLFVAFEDFDSVDDVGDTDFTGQQLTIWTDGKLVQAVGVHGSNLGMLEIPDHPELKGISVGIRVQDLLTKLGLNTSDITFLNSGPGGPAMYFPSVLPTLIFEVDCENGGNEEDEGAWIGAELEWLGARLHYPLSAIYAW
eukprot:TRINITY_DN47893_c0_g1_i1.p1 TRINITY_DN47893_c0_g1~~TRINITY_DN47893_c0_g1_i1.p1  ORF type:complete len:341 (+),score=37.18 TRINITY_DN47893_c0_g1_i1:33-1025(+)